MGKLNEILTGFRTILTAIAGYLLVWLLVFVDSFIGGLVGFGPDAIKGAAVAAVLITLKQIKTDVIPKLHGKLNK